METPPDPQVHDLGLVASVLGRIRLVESVDRLVGPRPGEKVSTGMALKAAILNALGEWALRRGLAGTGSSLPEEGQAYPKTHPALGVPALSGCVWPGWTTDPWSPTWPPIMRARCACWGQGDITSWSEGCGMWAEGLVPRKALWPGEPTTPGPFAGPDRNGRGGGRRGSKP